MFAGRMIGLTLSADWVTAFAATASAILLFGTMAVAFFQLGALNKASQLQNFIVMMQEADSREFSIAYGFVLGLRPLTLADQLRTVAVGEEHIDRVTNFFERVGFLVTHRYLTRRMAINWWGVLAKDAYDALEDWIKREQQRDPGFCSEFQAFVAMSEVHWRKCGRPVVRPPRPARVFHK